jgi:hypothetical protein
MTPGSMYHVAVTYDRSSTTNDPVLYIDGASKTVTERFSPSGSINGDESLNHFIARYYQTAGPYGDGLIDEVRISNIARSAAWIEAEHNNQKTDSTFYVIDDDWVGPCWNANYAYRKKMTITAGSDDIPADYSVSVTLDHAALVSAGKSLASGDDLRVAHWDGSSWTELDRALDPLSAWNDASTQIWFALVDPITASSSDGTYYLHYGYPSATNPPDDWANVFMVGDDFNDGTLTSGMTTSTSGTASITETGGKAFIDLGNDVGDAAILVTTNSLPSDKKFAIRHMTNLVSGGPDGSTEVKTIGISQYNTRLTVADSSIENDRRRIIAFHRVDEEAWIIQDPNVDGDSWTGSAWDGKWVKWGDLSPLDTYYIYDLISNGTSWYVKVSDANGNEITTTTAVPWSNIEDDPPGAPFWFYLGEVYTNAYYADQKSDWFYVRQYVDSEPTTSVAGEETGCRGAPTAIGLISFTATGTGNDVRIDWHTGHEVANLGFNIYRATGKDGPFEKINNALIPGLNYSALGKAYSYMDTEVSPGTLYYYKLEDIDAYGKHTMHGPICVDWDADGMPDDWEIRYGLNPWVNDADIDSDGDCGTAR